MTEAETLRQCVATTWSKPEGWYGEKPAVCPDPIAQVGETWEHVEDAESELQYVNAIRIGGWRPIRKTVVDRGHQAIPGEER